MPTSTRGQQYWHDPVGCGRCNVRNMEGLAAAVLLIVILLGVLLVIGGLVYLLAQRLPKRSMLLKTISWASERRKALKREAARQAPLHVAYTAVKVAGSPLTHGSSLASSRRGAIGARSGA